MATSPIVGRERELSWVDEQRELSRVEQRPSLVLLQGAAGIGKSRLISEVLTRARDAGWRAAVGRGYEGLVIPYYPWRELFADLDRDAEPDAEPFGPLLSLDAAPGEAPRSDARPGTEDRGRLFLALIERVRACCRRVPTLLVIDDVHWVDRSSLDLAVALAYALDDAGDGPGAPLTLLLASRTPEEHPLVATVLGRLSRLRIAQDLRLQGLDVGEVSALLESLAVVRPAPKLVLSIQDATGGNPLFVREVLAQLRSRNALEERDGYTVARRALRDLDIPVDVEQAIQQRVERLPPRSRQLLGCAALLGSSFTMDALALASGIPREECERLLRRARAFLQETDEQLQFSHPLLRAVLASVQPLRTRQRAHAAIASRLARCSPEPAEADIWRVARHLIEAGPAAESGMVREFCSRAARQAQAVYDWMNAGAAYAAVARCTGASKQRGEVLEKAALCFTLGGDIALGIEHYSQSLRAFREVGDRVGQARVLSSRAIHLNQNAPPGSLPDLAPFEEALALLADDEPRLRAFVHTRLANTYFHGGQPETAEAHAERALSLLDGQDGAERQEALTVLGMARAQRVEIAGALEALGAARELADRSDNVLMRNVPIQRATNVLYLAGRIAAARENATLGEEQARRENVPREQALAAGSLAMIAAATGEFHESEAHTEAARRMFARSHYAFGLYLALGALAYARYHEGDAAGARRALAETRTPGKVFHEPGPSYAERARMLERFVEATVEPAPERRRGEVNEALQRFFELRRRREDTLYQFVDWCLIVELASIQGLPGLLPVACERLSAAVERDVRLTYGWCFLLRRVLALGYWGMGLEERAAREFGLAVAEARSQQLGPELARACLDWARFDLARGEPALAVERLRTAGRAYARHPAAPASLSARSLASALGHRLEIDEPVGDDRPGTAYPPTAPRVLLVTDLEGFTATIVRLGDRRAQALMHDHNALLRSCIRRNGGAEITHTGDGLMASFRSAIEAVECGCEIAEHVSAYNDASDAPALRVRIGIHAGEPLAEEDRLFGATVNAAVRICHQAGAGEILVSATVEALAAAGGFEYHSLGLVLLRGFPRPIRLSRVEPTTRFGPSEPGRERGRLG